MSRAVTTWRKTGDLELEQRTAGEAKKKGRQISPPAAFVRLLGFYGSSI
jgi:hypothetical protein